MNAVLLPCLSVLCLICGCAHQPKLLVQGVAAGAPLVAIAPAARVGDVLDAPLAYERPRVVASPIRPRDVPEAAAARARLIAEVLGRKPMRREVRTRWGISAQHASMPFLSTPMLAKARILRVDALVDRMQYVRDLPLLEAVLNEPAETAEPYEAIRRLVVQDMRPPVGENAFVDHRWWMVVGQETGRSLAIELTGDSGAFTPADQQAVLAGVQSWIAAENLAIQCDGVYVLRAGATLRVSLSGDLAMRQELLPLCAKPDGSLYLAPHLAAR